MAEENESPAGQGGAEDFTRKQSEEKDSSKIEENQEDEASSNDDAHPVNGGTTTAAWSPNRTDLGNARRLVRAYGSDIRYCPPLNTWLLWDGVRWRPDEDGQIVRHAKSVSDLIAQEAIQEPDQDRKASLFKLAASAQSKGRIEAMMELTKTELGIPIAPGDLDVDPNLLGVRNGTVDLKTGRVLPADRNHFITKSAAVDYVGTAACSTWDRFIEEITGGDKELASFLRRKAGYFLTGSTAEQCLFFLIGSGDNGKGIYLNTLQALLGDYAKVTPPETFLARPSVGPTPDVARLRGARLVVASEPPENTPLNEALVKRLTGQDVISCRRLYSDPFEFRPTFKMVMAANHKPEVRGTDHAIWRRIHLIPFSVTIPAAKKDKELFEKLVPEYPGILNWALAGLHDYRHQGLNPPQSVQKATAVYRSEMDVLGQWIDERCDCSADSSTAPSLLYSDYLSFCSIGKLAHLGPYKFGDELEARGFPRGRTSATRGHQGIGLKPLRKT